MNVLRTLLLAVAAVATLAVRAGELTPEVEAKFLKVIVTSSGASKISCSDPARKAALEAQGLTVDASAPIVWVTAANEAKALKAMGKLVISNTRNLAASASVLIEEDGGRPKIFLNTANLHASKVQLGDVVLKITEKI
jgi:hypothetical protein